MKSETFLAVMQRIGKRDSPPRVNVVNGVMERIQMPPRQEVSRFDYLTWTAAVSTGIALVLGILAMHLSPETVDPLVQLVLNVPWGMI